MMRVDKNFIPEMSVKCYDYFCTWQSQADGAKKSTVTSEILEIA